MRTPAAPLEVTIDHHPDSGDPHPVPPRPSVMLVADPTSRSSTDIELLLRKRLRFIGALLVAMCALLTLVLWPIEISTYLQRAEAIPLAFWVEFSKTGLGLLTFGALSVCLWKPRPRSLRWLRAVETIMFGYVAFDLGMHQAFGAWLRPGWSHVLEVYRAGDHNLATQLMAGLASGSLWPWMFVLVLYGILIPNTSRRCALVVSAMALMPITVNAVVGFAYETPPKLWLHSLLLMAIGLTPAAAIAIYGSHRIEVLRRQASEARRLGQYQLQRRLGAGGMGEVYLAEHVLLRRPCAVKLIRPERAGDPRNLQRFEREVKTTATLTHPNTVQIFDYGRAEDGTFYYVMEYLPGLTLEVLVERSGPLPPARAVHFLRQVCGALREAHAAGLIHRDLKPSNVMVCERGGLHDTTKLLDFGLVLPMGSTDGSDKLTQEGAFAGTPAYVSPEQAGGHETLDERSDIYSVGALAYFLLTGRPPFVGLTAVKMLAAHLYEKPEPLSRHRPEVPADLEGVILRCLAKEPAERYPDAASLELALGQCECASAWIQREAALWWRTHWGSDGLVAGDVDRRPGRTRLWPKKSRDGR